MKVTPQSARVLVVDDEEASRYAFVRHLRQAGHEVLEASTGRDGLRLAIDATPELVLLDIQLPDLSGIEVCRQLKDNPTTRHIPIIQTSAHFTTTHDRIHGLESGADAYLITPFDPRELLAQVKALVRTVRSEAALRGAMEGYQRQVRIFEGIASTTPDFVYLFDPQGRFRYANRRLLEVWGMKLADVIGKTCRELGYEQWHHDMHMREIGQVIETKLPIKGEVQFKAPLTGIFGIYEYIFTPVLDAAGNVEFIAGTTRDVTQRIQAQEALRESEERFRSMANGLPLIVWMHDANGEQEFVNHTFCEFFGVRLEEMGGDRWQMLLHPADADAYRDAFSKSFTERRPFHAQVRVRAADGQWRWVESWARPRLSDSGEFLGFLGASADITERRNTEEDLRVAQEQLWRQAKLLEKTVEERTVKLRETIADLEEYSYSISHDMRAPLRTMASFSTILLEEYAKRLDDKGVDYLRRIAAAAQRLDDLIRDVLSYDQIAKSDLAVSPVNLDQLVAEVIATYPNLHSDKAGIEVANPLFPVLANRAWLTTCLSNLLGNAVKFVTPHARPAIRVWTERREAHVRLHVRDNGIGIDPQLIPRIWRLFERGHHNREYPGTGIGLSIVKRAVERMGGTVGVESQPGLGSTFWIELRSASTDTGTTPEPR